MGIRRTGDLPARLEDLRRRFEDWRRTRKVRTRIPNRLWASAVKLAGRHGIHRTAKALRVDYYALKKRVEAESAAAASNASGGTDGAAFLEFPAAAWGGAGECTMELEDGGGAKLRIHLKGFETPDLAALSRSFWQSEP